VGETYLVDYPALCSVSCQASRSCLCILLDLCPQAFVGSTDLPGTLQAICEGDETSAYLIVGGILQLHLVAQLAVRVSVPTHEIQRVPVRQLSCTKLRELFGVVCSLILAVITVFIPFTLSDVHRLVNKEILMNEQTFDPYRPSPKQATPIPPPHQWRGHPGPSW